MHRALSHSCSLFETDKHSTKGFCKVEGKKVVKFSHKIFLIINIDKTNAHHNFTTQQQQRYKDKDAEWKRKIIIRP